MTERSLPRIVIDHLNANARGRWVIVAPSDGLFRDKKGGPPYAFAGSYKKRSHFTRSFDLAEKYDTAEAALAQLAELSKWVDTSAYRVVEIKPQFKLVDERHTR